MSQFDETINLVVNFYPEFYAKLKSESSWKSTIITETMTRAGCDNHMPLQHDNYSV